MERKRVAPKKGHGWPLRVVIRRERLFILQNKYFICCVGCECLCNEWIEHENNEESLVFPRPSLS